MTRTAIHDATVPLSEPVVQPTLPGPNAKILLVSWGLPPQLTGSAAIVESFARNFSPDEMVLAGERPARLDCSGRDPKLPSVYYVDKEWTWPKRGQRYVRWVRWLLLPLMVMRLSRIVRRESCRAVVAVFPNEFHMLAAYLVAWRYRLPLYPYFHNTYVENRSGIAGAFARWLQPRVFAAAPIVFAWNDGLRDYYEASYPGVRFETLPYVLDEPPPAWVDLPPVGAPLRIALLGNLSESNIDATRRFLNAFQNPNEVHFTVFTATPDWFYAKVGIRGPNITYTRVAQAEVTAALRKYDVLYLPHGLEGGHSDVEYQTIFPTRTASYVVAGRPILAHSPKNAFVTHWLRRFDCAEIVEQPDEAALKVALRRLCEDAKRREELVANALAAAREFLPERVVGRFRQQLAEPFDSLAKRTSMRVPAGSREQADE